jgi:hypothetical protein
MKFSHLKFFAITIFALFIVAGSASAQTKIYTAEELRQQMNKTFALELARNSHQNEASSGIIFDIPSFTTAYLVDATYDYFRVGDRSWKGSKELTRDEFRDIFYQVMLETWGGNELLTGHTQLLIANAVVPDGIEEWPKNDVELIRKAQLYILASIGAGTFDTKTIQADFDLQFRNSFTMGSSVSLRLKALGLPMIKNNQLPTIWMDWFHFLYPLDDRLDKLEGNEIARFLSEIKYQNKNLTDAKIVDQLMEDIKWEQIPRLQERNLSQEQIRSLLEFIIKKRPEDHHAVVEAAANSKVMNGKIIKALPKGSASGILDQTKFWLKIRLLWPATNCAQVVARLAP